MNRSALIASAIALLLAVSASASMPVPVDVQTDLFVNIGKLDRAFDPTKRMTIGIIYQQGYPESVGVKDAMIAAIKQRNLPIVCVPLEAGSAALLRKRLAETDANTLEHHHDKRAGQGGRQQPAAGAQVGSQLLQQAPDVS
jgi:hypothetical protein